MLSMAVQPNLNACVKPLTLPYQNLLLTSFKASVVTKPKPFSQLHSVYLKNLTCSSRNLRLSASASTIEETVAEEAPVDDIPAETTPNTEKLGVVVKPTEKPRLVLKFIWMEKNIGIGLDQVIPGHGTIPLSPYYFWPRKDAWEELKNLLESKPWISQKQMIILLNQATDIINLWQQSGGNLA
ncbi:30S ribosomal protein 3, chloroplastic [Quillaja saponaria]|uniref:30S ribosomal protein 3, chloroplastic n=1 Tax=Quillaja saponaria TaxID=32244 RepID=A0AAD7VCH3_QUISA|nr:30S ribosomal protein 3, chloroplastic [Quillaja saponaria]